MRTGLRGRTVIITGASRNIGARAAELFDDFFSWAGVL